MHKLQRLTAERERLVTQRDQGPPADHEARVAGLAAERERLRAKIEELKGEIATGATQRADLRRELVRLSAPRRTATRSGPSAADDAESDAGAEIGEAGVAAPRSVLVPNYATTAAKALAMLPRQAAAQSLHAIAALAGGETHTWRSIKRMRATDDVLLRPRRPRLPHPLPPAQRTGRRVGYRRSQGPGCGREPRRAVTPLFSTCLAMTAERVDGLSARMDRREETGVEFQPTLVDPKVGTRSSNWSWTGCIAC